MNTPETLLGTLALIAATATPAMADSKPLHCYVLEMPQNQAIDSSPEAAEDAIVITTGDFLVSNRLEDETLVHMNGGKTDVTVRIRYSGDVLELAAIDAENDEILGKTVMEHETDGGNMKRFHFYFRLPQRGMGMIQKRQRTGLLTCAPIQ